MGVNATCRVCKKEAPADSFRLHHEHKQMVCPSCFKNNSTSEPKVQPQANPLSQMPATSTKPKDWDKVDEYLERAQEQRREENQAQFSKIPGTDLVRCTCQGCKYNFRYDPFRKTPHSCPYCDQEIPKLRMFNLL